MNIHLLISPSCKEPGSDSYNITSGFRHFPWPPWPEKKLIEFYLNFISFSKGQVRRQGLKQNLSKGPSITMGGFWSPM